MAAICSSDLPSLRGAQMKPISPLIARKPTNIHASVWNPVAVSHGTKKLKMPSAMRTTANIIPCAVLRSSVGNRSEEHTSELQSLMRNSYAVFCLKKKKNTYSILEITKTTNQHYNNYYQTLTNTQI